MLRDSDRTQHLHVVEQTAEIVIRVCGGYWLGHIGYFSD